MLRGLTRFAVVAALPVVALAAPGAAHAAFSKPVRIGKGAFTSVASDGKHLYVASSPQWDGIWYYTNRSGSWKGRHLAIAKGGDASLPSIALDRKGHVYVAYTLEKSSGFGGLKAVGIALATNRSGSWVRRRVTWGEDYYPSVGVSGSEVSIAFMRGNAATGDASIRMVTHSPTTNSGRAISTGIGVYGAPRLVMRSGAPAVAYGLYRDAYSGSTVKQACGLWVWQGGTSTRWTTPPGFPDCGSSGFGYDRDIEAAGAADGMHLFALPPVDAFGPPGPDPTYSHFHRDGGSTVADPLPTGEAHLENASSTGTKIDLALAVQESSNPANGIYTLRLARTAGGWSAGPRRRVTAPGTNGGSGGVYDTDPAVAVSGGKLRVLFTRVDLHKSSPHYGEQLLYVTHD